MRRCIVRWEYCVVMAKMARPWKIYLAMVISRLLYAASAWWGFTTAADRQHMDTFIRRGIRAGFCDENMPAICLILSRTLTVRFSSGLWEINLFPDRKTELKYDLTQRRHECTLTQRHLANCNFISRTLCKGCYYGHRVTASCVLTACLINECNTIQIVLPITTPCRVLRSTIIDKQRRRSFLVARWPATDLVRSYGMCTQLIGSSSEKSSNLRSEYGWRPS